MLLETGVDPLAFDSWIQVTALAILVLGGIMYKLLADKAKTTQEDVSKIVKTLTTNNSGSHIKDQLDRFETVIAQVLDNQSVVTHNQAEIIKSQEEHLAWSAEFAAEQKVMHEKLNEELASHNEQFSKVWETVSPTTPQETE